MQAVTTKKPPKRRAVFRCAAILLGLLPFVVLEITLRWTGFGVPTSYQDPFVGFSRLYSLFELDDAHHVYQTARHHHYFFGLQSFAAQKDPQTFRVFCLGGSTVQGHPYDTETSFSKWLELELALHDSAARYEIINCGGMSYASYRLIPILEEVLAYEPDLVVVMTGHNEFLEDRTYREIKQRSKLRAYVEDRLLSLHTVTVGRHALDALVNRSDTQQDKTVLDQDVSARLDHESGYASYHRDEAWSQSVIEHYALNLRVMVQLCQRVGVPIVLLNPGCNIRDCAPFKSEHKAELKAQRLIEWNELFDQATQLDVASPERALDVYLQAFAIDDVYALLSYRIARCLDRLNRLEEAREYYYRAKDLDVCPLRILEVMQQKVFEVARQTKTPIVDVARLLKEKTANGIAGYDWYVDQVHPSIRGHQLISEAVVETLISERLIRAEKSPREADQRRTRQRHMQPLGDEYLAAGRRRVQWLDHWARRDRMKTESVPLDARGYFNLGNAYIEFAEYDDAITAYRRACEEEPRFAARLVERALQLFRSGRNAAAKIVIQTSLELNKDPTATDEGLLALAVIAYEEGQVDEARQIASKITTIRHEGSNPNPWLLNCPELDRVLRVDLKD